MRSVHFPVLMITHLLGDCSQVLKALPAASIHCCVTSPPYWGLRDYGVENQMGLELSIEEFIANMVGVFQEVRRVLRDDGTLWLNMGDNYASQAHISAGIKRKDLVGQPWLLAFALRQDGWYLRSDIIWHKPNPMPETVYDRPTKAHEYIFLLSKNERYFYDAEAIRERVSGRAHTRGSGINPKSKIPTGWETGDGAHTKKIGRYKSKQNASFSSAVSGLVENRNKRDVWTVGSKSFKEAHFATFPPDLIRPCILAGSPRGGSVLDPFGGSGTTALVAEQEGRDCTLIELNPAYVAIAKKRTQQMSLLCA